MYVHFPTIYVFISNAVKMSEAHMYSFWYSSFQLDCDKSCYTDTLMFDLAVSVILSALPWLALMPLWEI